MGREYIGFVCKEDCMQSKLFCHVLKADDKNLVSNLNIFSHLLLLLNYVQANKVVCAFRTAFSTALAFHFPSVLCDSCPLSRLNYLSRSMEGDI